jgi:bifunctional oligoribonuclease and PAP phosphatase NrnA
VSANVKEALLNTPGAMEVRQRLLDARTVVLATHEGPDADGMGSQVALSRALRRLGKRVWIRNADPPNKRFRFLDAGDELCVYRREDAGVVAQADLALLVDTAEFRRAGTSGEAFAARTGPTLAIDHHAPNGNTIPGLLAQEFSSTGEIVARLLPLLGVPLSKEVADPLLAAILFDTAQFRFCRNDPEVFATAADLVRAGADAERVGKLLFGTSSKDAKMLEARVLQAARFECGGRLAWAVIDRDALSGLSVDRDEVRSMVNLLGDIEGVEIACLFKTGETRLKISLRSRGGHPIVDVAESLGGGGHPFAAGVDVADDLETAKSRTLPLLRAKLEG